MVTGPALVSILRQGSYLVASIHTALDDSQMVRFQQDLVEQIGQHRARGVDHRRRRAGRARLVRVPDSAQLAEMARLRGALTVIVGIQPDVAFAMVELGMGTGAVATALDLEEGLAYLDANVRPSGPVLPAAKG